MKDKTELQAQIITELLQSLKDRQNKNMPGLKMDEMKDTLDKRTKENISKTRLSGVILTLLYFGLIEKFADTSYYQITIIGVSFLNLMKKNIKPKDILARIIK